MGRFNTLFWRVLALILSSLVIGHFLTFVLVLLTFHVRMSPPPVGGGLPVVVIIELLSWILVAWLCARMIARPIQQLARAATELGDNVNSAPLDENGSVEERGAARAFNRMQQRLREQIASRARFLAAVSHDLRTPLTRMRLRVERLADGDGRGKLRADVEEMRAMLDATLDYLRDEARNEVPAMLDVLALLESMADDYQEQGLAVSITGAAAPLPVQTIALRRALNNLIENAVRYGREARIALADDGGALCIEIRDDGPGIPHDQLEAVFEPFYRIESSRNKDNGGAGLGLSIAREAVQRQGGTLTLSNHPGGGLLASMRLPR